MGNTLAPRYTEPGRLMPSDVHGTFSPKHIIRDHPGGNANK